MVVICSPSEMFLTPVSSVTSRKAAMGMGSLGSTLPLGKSQRPKRLMSRISFFPLHTTPPAASMWVKLLVKCFIAVLVSEVQAKSVETSIWLWKKSINFGMSSGSVFPQQKNDGAAKSSSFRFEAIINFRL